MGGLFERQYRPSAPLRGGAQEHAPDVRGVGVNSARDINRPRSFWRWESRGSHSQQPGSMSSLGWYWRRLRALEAPEITGRLLQKARAIIDQRRKPNWRGMFFPSKRAFP